MEGCVLCAVFGQPSAGENVARQGTCHLLRMLLQRSHASCIVATQASLVWQEMIVAWSDESKTIGRFLPQMSGKAKSSEKTIVHKRHRDNMQPNSNDNANNDHTNGSGRAAN